MDKFQFFKFCGSVWSHWEARFGGTFAVILAIAQYLFLAFGDPAKIPQWVKDFPPLIWLAVGAVLFFWSCYGAWHDERRMRLKAEERLDQKQPDIKGKIVMTFWETPISDLSGLPMFRDSRYYVKLELVNHRDSPCTVSSYKMCIALGEGEVLWSEDGKDFISGKIKHTANFMDSLTTNLGLEGSETYTGIIPRIDARFPLTRGCAREVWVTFDVKGHHPDFKSDGPDCVQDFFYVQLTDSLGHSHQIEAPGAVPTVCLGKFSS